MARVRFFVLILFTGGSAFAQVDRYVVFFKDKNNIPFTISAPESFLSARSIERRTKQKIAITSEDLPVNGGYVNAVKQTGVEVYYRSKWKNCLLVEATPAQVAVIQSLSSVASVERVAPGARLSGGRVKQFKNRNGSGTAEATFSQLTMLGLDQMHKEGVRGEGVFVAIFDSGFQGVNSASSFQHLFDKNQLNDVFDFIGHSKEVFRYDDHGTEVFSVIAAESPTFSGGAPDATFHLYVTEDVTSEYRIEEYNWLFAAEKADSIGVDVIQSSLGYNLFDDADMDYQKSDLNGETAVISQAAKLAIDRGIVVVASAGNEGNNSWRLVTPPADIDGILAVGSVTGGLSKSSFSSIGPTADNRIKPDVVALGSGTAVIRPNGTIGSANGTSLAAPLVTSLVAGLIQRFQGISAARVYEVVTTTASQAGAPDNQLGYGIPNYAAIHQALAEFSPIEEIQIFPNPVSGFANVLLKTLDQDVTISVFDIQGRALQQATVYISWRNNPIELDLSMLPRGIYLVKVQTKDNFKTEKIIKE